MEKDKVEVREEWFGGMKRYFVPANTPEDLRIMEEMLIGFLDMAETMRNKRSLQEEIKKMLAQTRAAQKGVRIDDIVKDMHGMLWKVIRIIPAAGDEPELICKNLDKDLETALCIKDVEVVND